MEKEVKKFFDENPDAEVAYTALGFVKATREEADELLAGVVGVQVGVVINPKSAAADEKAAHDLQIAEYEASIAGLKQQLKDAKQETDLWKTNAGAAKAEAKELAGKYDAASAELEALRQPKKK